MTEFKDPDARDESPFDALNRADARMSASSRVEETLRAEVRGRTISRRRMPGSTLALAASLALMIGASAWLMRGGGQVSAPGDPETPEASTESVTEFMPLGYSRTSAGPTHIVRLEVPRKALASFGLLPMDAVAPADSDTVLADVIIGDDGVARAVRFVRATSH